jgi:hypothetical protein
VKDFNLKQLVAKAVRREIKIFSALTILTILVVASQVVWMKAPLFSWANFQNLTFPLLIAFLSAVGYMHGYMDCRDEIRDEQK